MTARRAVNNAVITPGIVVNNKLIPSQCAVRGNLGAHGPLSSSHLLSSVDLMHHGNTKSASERALNARQLGRKVACALEPADGILQKREGLT